MALLSDVYGWFFFVLYKIPTTHDHDDTSRHFRGEPELIWFNLREEAIVYINDNSYVLRDSEYPYKNMHIFTDIRWSQLVNIENQLKYKKKKKNKKLNFIQKFWWLLYHMRKYH